MTEERSEPRMAAERKTRGFKKNAAKIAKKQGIPVKQAKAILAKGAQKASPAAKRANPRLKRVATKGSKKSSGGTKRRSK